jgi:hypothetical protein
MNYIQTPLFSYVHSHKRNKPDEEFRVDMLYTKNALLMLPPFANQILNTNKKIIVLDDRNHPYSHSLILWLILTGKLANMMIISDVSLPQLYVAADWAENKKEEISTITPQMIQLLLDAFKKYKMIFWELSNITTNRFPEIKPDKVIKVLPKTDNNKALRIYLSETEMRYASYVIVYDDNNNLQLTTQQDVTNKKRAQTIANNLKAKNAKQ